MQPDVLSNNFGLLNLGSSSRSACPRRLRNTSNNRGSRSRKQPSASDSAETTTATATPHVEIPLFTKSHRSGDANATRTSRRPLVQQQQNRRGVSDSNNMTTTTTTSLRRAGSLRSNPITFSDDTDHEVENKHSRHASGSSSAAGVKRKRPALTTIKRGASGSGSAGSYNNAILIDSDEQSPAATARTRAARSRSTSTNSNAVPPAIRRSSSSRSSLSLRQKLTNLVLSERYAPDEQQSPTRGKATRGNGHSNGRVSSRTRTASASSSTMLMADESSAEEDNAASSRSEDDDEEDDENEQDESSGDEEDTQGERQTARYTSPLHPIDHLLSLRYSPDERLLLAASFWQLERLRKDRLETLATKAGLDTDGLKKIEIVDLIVENRPVDVNSGPPSSNTRSSGGKARASSGTMSRLSQPPSDHSADYTDDDGDDGGDEDDDDDDDDRHGTSIKTTTRATGKRTRKTAAHLQKNRTSPHKPSPVKRNFGRRIAGRRTTEAVIADDASSPSKAPAYAASPMVNRLRKQKSLLFAASSPVRTRARPRPTLGTPGGAANVNGGSTPNHASPIKPRLRPRARNGKSVSAPHHDEKHPDDQMDEDWIDSVSLSQDSNPRSRLAIEQDTTDEEDAEMQDDQQDDDEDEGSDTLQQQSSSSESEDEGERQRSSSTLSGYDSDQTDGPGRNGTRAASPSSPTKMRRLRNGKLRILPEIQVEDTDGEVDAVLATADSPVTPKAHRRTSGKVAAVKTPKAAQAHTKPRTPPLSTDNAEAQSADGENLDELNGLDLESLNLTDKEISPRQLQKSSRIGSGGFKDVYVGVWRVGKRKNKVAIADIREKLTEMDIKELGLLRDLKHENIVRFIGVSIPEDTARTGIPCMIVSELCSNGDLWDYIRATKPPADLQIFRMLLETARGLEYLHMHSIVHRDVKSSNVLVTRNRSCKINDFGLARVKRSQRSKMKSVVGTVNWQAVELWCKAPQYNEKVDVWSAAMTFWEALQWHEEYKSYPFESMNEFEIYEEVGKNGMRPPTERIGELFGEEIVKLLNRMWDADARKRPTMDMVCKDLEKLIEMKTLEMEQ